MAAGRVFQAGMVVENELNLSVLMLNLRMQWLIGMYSHNKAVSSSCNVPFSTYDLTTFIANSGFPWSATLQRNQNNYKPPLLHQLQHDTQDSVVTYMYMNGHFHYPLTEQINRYIIKYCQLPNQTEQTLSHA
jgi:hypothetical protein